MRKFEKSYIEVTNASGIIVDLIFTILSSYKKKRKKKGVTTFLQKQKTKSDVIIYRVMIYVLYQDIS